MGPRTGADAAPSVAGMTPVQAHEPFASTLLGATTPVPRAPRDRLPLWVTVTALAIGAALVGCAPAAGSDDPGDHAGAVTSEAAPSTTAAGDVAVAAPEGSLEPEPTEPADATPSEPAFTPDDASAIAVAEEFVRALDITLSAGDSESLLAISATTCGSCADYAETGRSNKAMHETVTGGALTVHSPPEVTAREEAIGALAVTVPLAQEAGERFGRLGESMGTWDAAKYRLHVELVASPTGWLVTGSDSYRIVETD